MNERIELLSKQAWHLIDVSTIRGRHRAYTKIFAELVINECADWIKNTDPNEVIGEENAAALQDYFGVNK
jgi:hypothetical protein